MRSIFSILVVSLFYISIFAQQDTLSVSSTLVTTSFEHVSIHVNIEGDDNRNAYMELSYKLTSESTYRPGAECMRAYPSMVVDGASLNRNFFAGSIMFLSPGESYDIRIDITDPDGVVWTDDIQVITKEENSYANLSAYYAVPGDGGGSGTIDDPFLGLQAAADNVTEGSLILAQDGIYAPFEITISGAENLPIVFQSESLHGAVIDGAGTDRGAITIGVFDAQTHFISIDGFQIKDAEWGVDAQNTADIVVKNNKFSDVEFGYVNRREGGLEENQYIHNNEFLGRTFWPQSGIPSGRAIDLRGNNNVVSYNFVSNFGDGVSLDGPPYGSSYGIDIHHNDFINIVDDFIEVDGMISNARIYRNRGINGRAAVSVAPVFGGPCYVFRNEFYNVDISTFKMNRSPAGLYLVHNTSLKYQNATSSPAGWQETIVKNNILCGTRYCFEEYGLVDGSTDDWNYNAYFSTRDPAEEPWFKWDDERYDNIEELQSETAIEAIGIAIDMNEFINASVPTSYETAFGPEDFNVQLAIGAGSINTGVVLPNINDPFVIDGLPDRGAFEYGMEVPKYGPDFSVVSFQKEWVSVDFKISPNPAQNQIEIHSDYTFAEIRIFNLEGKLVLKTTKQQIVNLKDLKPAVYYLAIYNSSANQVGIKKLVILH